MIWKTRKHFKSDGTIIYTLSNSTVPSFTAEQKSIDNELNEDVKKWLYEDAKLKQWEKVLMMNGIDSMDIVKSFTEHQLKSMDITMIGHQIKISNSIESLQCSCLTLWTCLDCCWWLKQHISLTISIKKLCICVCICSQYTVWVQMSWILNSNGPDFKVLVKTFKLVSAWHWIWRILNMSMI